MLALGASLVGLLVLPAGASAHGYLRKTGDVLRYTAPDPRTTATVAVSSPRPGTVQL